MVIHLPATAVRGQHVRVGLSDVDPFDLHRHVYSRSGLDLVLAGRNLGPQHRGVRSESRSARDHCRLGLDVSEFVSVESNLRCRSCWWLLHRWRPLLSLADDARAISIALSQIMG